MADISIPDLTTKDAEFLRALAGQMRGEWEECAAARLEKIAARLEALDREEESAPTFGLAMEITVDGVVIFKDDGGTDE